MLHTPELNLFFFTDASLVGWGASWQERQIMGQWSPLVQQHINCLEAVRLAICHWGPHWFQQTDCVYCDNSTGGAYISKQGVGVGVGGWWWTFSISVPQVSRIVSTAGQVGNNTCTYTSSGSPQCDSRCTLITRQSQSHGGWRLPLGTSNSLFSAFGAALMNMFATAENKVTPIYVSSYPDDIAWAVEAISISWDDLGLIYAFPPAPIVPRTLERNRNVLRNDAASQHPSRSSWHPLLLQLSAQPRIPLLDVELFQFIPNHRRPQCHREPSLLDLTAWLLSATSSDDITSLSL